MDEIEIQKEENQDLNLRLSPESDQKEDTTTTNNKSNSKNIAIKSPSFQNSRFELDISLDSTEKKIFLEMSDYERQRARNIVEQSKEASNLGLRVKEISDLKLQIGLKSKCHKTPTVPKMKKKRRNPSSKRSRKSSRLHSKGAHNHRKCYFDIVNLFEQHIFQ